MSIEPLHLLTFPVILGAATPGGVSASFRQNGSAGGKSVGLLWKGKLSPGRGEGDGESRTSHFSFSPWHAAPLHLPLVGQNCWPHMASGFSASLWLRLSEQDGDKRKGETLNSDHVVNMSGCLRWFDCWLPEDNSPPAAQPHHSSRTRMVEDGKVHIMSMGSKALMLQMWADFSKGSLTFRWFSAKPGCQGKG